MKFPCQNQDRVSAIEWLSHLTATLHKHQNKHMPKQKDYYLRAQTAALIFQKKLAIQNGALLTTRNANRSVNSTSASMPTNDYLRAASIKEKNRSILKKCLKEKDQNSINIENNNCRNRSSISNLSNPVVSSRELEAVKNGEWPPMDMNNNEFTCVTEIRCGSGKLHIRFS